MQANHLSLQMFCLIRMFIFYNTEDSKKVIGFMLFHRKKILSPNRRNQFEKRISKFKKNEDDFKRSLLLVV